MLDPSQITPEKTTDNFIDGPTKKARCVRACCYLFGVGGVAFLAALLILTLWHSDRSCAESIDALWACVSSFWE